MMKRLIFFLGISWCYFSFAQAMQEEWARCYKKRFSHAKKLDHKDLSSLTFGKKSVPLFTQLIFSWNAHRPTRGYYRFSAQVRDAGTQQWHDWHTMIEWGQHAQRSFFNESKTGTKYQHVRLEIPPATPSDAFRIKIDSHDGADLSQLASLSVTTANFPDFQAEDAQRLSLSLSSVYVEGVGKQSQMVLEHPRKEALCSPTSCSIVSSFFSGAPIDPIAFAARSYDAGLDAYGSWPFNTVTAYEMCKGDFFFYVTRFNSFVQIHQSLKKNWPVVVSVRGPLLTAPREYKNGHLLVIVGFDAQNKMVVCHDPAFEKTEDTAVSYPLDSFLKAWERSRRLSYIAERATIPVKEH
ncbi:MAG TPA: C39 family peptidase [Candidatus Babeliales bacterium]|nr:C39 family peptidase [Candidatus Babeliales bacterium]